MNKWRMNKDAKKVLDNWMGKTGEILFVQEEDGTYFVTIAVKVLQGVYFLRLFTIAGVYHLSCDHSVGKDELMGYVTNQTDDS